MVLGKRGPGVRLCLWLMVVSLATACAPIRLPSFEKDDQAAQVNRLARIAFPLAVAATESCPFERELTYGVMLGEQTPMDSAKGSPARVSLVIRFVHPGLPAGATSLRAGETLLAINETQTEGMTVEQAQGLISRVSRARIQPLTFVVQQGEEMHEVNMWGTPACRFAVQLLDDQHVAAMADGNRILITTAMLKFTQTEEELAWVVAHELAHNILGHSQSTRLRGILNAFLSSMGSEAGEEVDRPAFEMQADALAIRLLARTGYDFLAGREFLRRLARAEQFTPNQSAAMVTHPESAERIAAFDRVAAEIDVHMRQGTLVRVPLRPEHDAALASQENPLVQP